MLDKIKLKKIKKINSNIEKLNLNKKFDIIFLDPPYKHKNLEDLFNKIKDSNILNSEGIIIIHRHKNEKDNFLSKFNIIEEKNYGISKIIFLTF